MGKIKPCGIPGEKNYDIDYDPNYQYHEEWAGLIYDKETETKMLETMDTSMPDQAKLFATEKTYLYYTRYFAMLNKMDEIRRENVLANINKSVEDPLQFQQKFTSGSMSLGVVNTTLGVGTVAAMIYALRFIKG